MPTPPTILGVPIAQLVASGLGSKLLPATLTKIVATPGSYDIANPGAGIAKTSTSYSCRAVVTKMENLQIVSEQTATVKGEIMILLATVAKQQTPAIGDTITVTWPDGVKRIAIVAKLGKVDPSGATATVQVSA